MTDVCKKLPALRGVRSDKPVSCFTRPDILQLAHVPYKVISHRACVITSIGMLVTTRLRALSEQLNSQTAPDSQIEI